MLVSLHFFFSGVSVGKPKEGKALILVELLVNEICAHFKIMGNLCNWVFTVSLVYSFLDKGCSKRIFVCMLGFIYVVSYSLSYNCGS